MPSAQNFEDNAGQSLPGRSDNSCSANNFSTDDNRRFSEVPNFNTPHFERNSERSFREEGVNTECERSSVNTSHTQRDTQREKKETKSWFSRLFCTKRATDNQQSQHNIERNLQIQKQHQQYSSLFPPLPRWLRVIWKGSVPARVSTSSGEKVDSLLLPGPLNQ